MNLQLTLAARYLVGRKLRTALTTLAIVFGVLLIFGMNTVLPTMVAALQANVQGMEGEVDFTVANLSGATFPEDVIDRLQNIDGVRAMTASLDRAINLPADFVDRDPSHPDTVTAIHLIGVTPEEARALRSYPVLAGRYLAVISAIRIPPRLSSRKPWPTHSPLKSARPSPCRPLRAWPN